MIPVLHWFDIDDSLWMPIASISLSLTLWIIICSRCFASHSSFRRFKSSSIFPNLSSLQRRRERKSVFYSDFSSLFCTFLSIVLNIPLFLIECCLFLCVCYFFRSNISDFHGRIELQLIEGTVLLRQPGKDKTLLELSHRRQSAQVQIVGFQFSLSSFEFKFLFTELLDFQS